MRAPAPTCPGSAAARARFTTVRRRPHTPTRTDRSEGSRGESCPASGCTGARSVQALAMRFLSELTRPFILPSLLCVLCPAATGAVQAVEACPGGPPPTAPGRTEPRFLDIDEPTVTALLILSADFSLRLRTVFAINWSFCTVLVPAAAEGSDDPTLEQAPGGTVRRRFLLRLPADYDPESRHPVVLDLHGYSSTAAIQHAYSGFAHIADEHSFIGVWPDGSGDCLGETPGCAHSWDDCSSCLQGWNCLGTSVGQSMDGVQTCNPDRKAWGRYGCYASCGAVCEPREDNTTDTCVSSSCWDDIGFIDAVIDWLLANLCVDEERIHLTGLSNGAMMNYQLASSHVGHRIASMVPVAGLPLLGFLDPDQGPWSAVPVRPIALMDVHGMLDHVGASSYLLSLQLFAQTLEFDLVVESTTHAQLRRHNFESHELIVTASLC